MKRLSTQAFDVVLLDLGLPDSSGIETFSRLHAQAQNVPVIVLTGFDDDEVGLKAVQSGAHDYLIKGQMSASVLRRCIRYAVERQRSLVELERRTQQLIESEARSRNIIDSNADAVVIVDTMGLVRFVNPAAERIYGRSTDALLGHPFGFSIEANESVTELKFLAADGTPRVAEMHVSRIHWDGAPAVLASLRDVSGRVRMEVELKHALVQMTANTQALRAAEERMRFALENANIGIWDMDYTTGVVKWSDIIEAQYGLEPGTFGGTFEAFVKLVHPDDRESLLQTVEKAMRSGTDFSVQHRAVWPDGNVRWLSGVGRIRLGAHGEPLRGVGISIDNTERHNLELQFSQAQKMEAVGQLAGGIAHDFNNILTAIHGFTNLVIESFEPDDQRRSDLQEVIKAAERATTLTRQLLAFSRKQAIQPVAVDLNALVAGLHQMLQRLIGEQINLVTLFAPDLAIIRADPGQIEQIITNLVVNARDAMPLGGRVAIETANAKLDDSYVMYHRPVIPGSYVMVAVSDSGIGMDETTKQHIFEPFFTTKGPGKGTGLGLATVYGIVKQNDGYVWVYSEPGAGSTFKIYLPVATDQTLNVPSRDSGRHAVLGGTETVLLVEDEDGVRSLARTILEKAGYRVVEAANASKAETLFADNPLRFGLVLTDVIMPGTSGPKLYERLVQLRSGLKVLYMSGYTDDEVLNRGHLKPGVDFLQKPFTAAELRAKVRSALDR
jgi:PAS domain S-box-containing protein